MQRLHLAGRLNVWHRAHAVPLPQCSAVPLLPGPKATSARLRCVTVLLYIQRSHEDRMARHMWPHERRFRVQGKTNVDRGGSNGSVGQMGSAQVVQGSRCNTRGGGKRESGTGVSAGLTN